MNEFEFIKNIKKKYGLDLVGDDCAVLPKDNENDLLLTADMIVEEIDFKLDWTTPQLLGQRSLAVSLSDIAAMGGDVTWGMLSIGVPEHLWEPRFLDAFYEGWHDLAAMYEVDLVGGDVSRTTNRFVIDSIVGGIVPKGKAILRSGARCGDGVFVSGPLGGAAAGLKLLKEGMRYDPKSSDPQSLMILKQLRPLPQLRLGKQLQEDGLATSMIDLSDGLSSDIAHICRASGTGARIFAEEMPFDADLLEVAGSVDEMLELTLHGGEDFELLFTGNSEKISAAGLSDVFRIGEITDNPGVIEVVRGGTTELLPAKGYRHF
ncbi:MAG: thiamine-phosphate kinase [Pyrinomonadaceae bacterium]|nr:thiamine-phosphate kinase [Blastocatellia bacterium]MCW5958476.1 thiamine-phosphate kinase [Pyrinomonadaceae bacterium]